MMKKQLQKFKLGVENLSRPSKPDKNSEELLAADNQVERYKDVLEKIVKKFAPTTGSSVGGVSLPGSGSSSNSGGLNGDGPLDAASREKRCKKLHEYRLAQAMEESSSALPGGLLRDVLENCARLERSIANEIVDNEAKVEASVTRKLTDIMDKHLITIQKQKRIVTKLMQDKESAKYKLLAAERVQESHTKCQQLRDEKEECETKLEKERDIWAAEMFELIAEEENIANYIVNYVTAQRLYYKSALEQIEEVMTRVDGLIRGSNKRIFKVPLEEHLSTTNRKIAHVIEMCVCCLLERGLNEEGLLRVGCAGSKLRRFRTAIDASKALPPLSADYNDVHVIAGILKLYLRDLPDPLLTFRLYDEFVAATRRSTEDQCKRAILNAVNQLPAENYLNLRYLTKFLSILAENQAQNKMSSQNIAIVMSPNLLWSPANDTDTATDSASDYLQKVNSSTAVNRIVELLVAEWSFFFDGEIDFYQTLRREDLFRENGHGPGAAGATTAASGTATAPHGQHSAVEISEPMLSHSQQQHVNHAMTKSMNAAMVHHHGSETSASSGAAMNASATAGQQQQQEQQQQQTHSRSNSHDTSLILLSGPLDQAKRSQSSSSLSDASSPPGMNSPKLPVRRKHNKSAAPTPPDTRYAHGETFRNEYDDHYHPQHQQHHSNAGKPTAAARHIFESNDNLSNNGTAATAAAPRPDKPPRPSFVSTECQTLNRSQYRSAKESTSSSHARPSALPKGMLFTNRSTENLSDKADNGAGHDGNRSPVQLRDGSSGSGGGGAPAVHSPTTGSGGKPAIPERPISLMRPNSFKNSSAAMSTSEPFTGEPLKKTHSFRGANACKPLNGQTTLERTHIYNVDKKQVAIIDFVDTKTVTATTTTTPSEGKNGSGNAAAGALSPSIVTASLKITPASSVQIATSTAVIATDDAAAAVAATEQSAADASNASGPVSYAVSTVPPSPRGFDPKIKRPQIPAPPPPIGATATAASAASAACAAPVRPKSQSSGGGGDSTQL